MKLLLIRHAESLNQVYERGENYDQLRLPDPPLSDRGFQQAQMLADWSAREPIFADVTHLFCSPMRRAIQTAGPLAARHGLDVQLMVQAYEWGGVNAGPAGGFAALPGTDEATLRQDCSGLRWPAELAGQPWHGGYEPWEESRFAERARAVLEVLRQYGEKEVVALVTHSDFSGSLMRELLMLPASVEFRLDNIGTTLLETGTKKTTIHWLNRGPETT